MAILNAFGTGFASSRSVTIYVIVLPVIGLIERYGLQEQARRMIGKLRDIFVAVGSILLITGFVDATYHLKLDALQIALWAIPTGICALILHGARMLYLDRQLDKLVRSQAGSGAR